MMDSSLTSGRRKNLRKISLVLCAGTLAVGLVGIAVAAKRTRLGSVIEFGMEYGPTLIKLAKAIFPEIADAADLYRDLIEKRATAPESCTIAYTCATLTSIDGKLKTLSSNTIDAIVPEEIKATLAEIETLQAAVKNGSEEMAEIDRKILSAPDKVPPYDPITSTKVDLQKRRAMVEVDVINATGDLRSKPRRIVEFFKEKTGVELTTDDVEDLASFPSGSAYLKSIVFVTVARALNREFETRLTDAVTAGDIGRLNDTRDVLIRAYADNFDSLLSLYDKEWLPKVDVIRIDLEQQVKSNTEKATSAAIAENRTAFGESAKQATELLQQLLSYSSQLRAQRQSVASVLAGAKETVDAAEAQRKVRKAAADLGEMKRQSQAANAVFLKLSLPDFGPVSTVQDRLAFEKLTAKIAR
jgi:hypothetical protein